jgi:hypothetical protein
MRGGFSDRNAIKPVNVKIQLTDFDERTRVQLQNLLSQMYKYVYDNDLYEGRPEVQDFLQFVYGTVYLQCIDTSIILHEYVVLDALKKTIMNDDYDDVLTVVEAIVRYWDDYLKRSAKHNYYNQYSHTYNNESLFDFINACFEQEYVGYRFLDGIIVPISDSLEIKAIRESLENSYQPVHDHISKANSLLANREAPDYENSIKESITAVETICEILTGTKGKDATLGNMLKKLKINGVEIHSTMEIAFNKLYGYTSDANGIRHAGDIGGPASTFEDAKFMLVSCCAFINYLVANSSK